MFFTHLLKAQHFSTPWKHQETLLLSDVSREQGKGAFVFAHQSFACLTETAGEIWRPVLELNSPRSG